jgi:hypothetical protein
MFRQSGEFQPITGAVIPVTGAAEESEVSPHDVLNVINRLSRPGGYWPRDAASLTPAAPEPEPAPLVRLFGSQQDSAIVEPEANPEALRDSAKGYARRLLAPAWEGIGNYAVAGNDALRERQSSLLGDMVNLIETMTEFLTDARTAKMAILRKEHRAKRNECRNAKDALTELQKALAPIQGDVRFAQDVTSKARANFRAWRNAEPKAENFPTDKEIVEWRKGLAEAQGKLAAAEAAETRALESYGAAVGKVRAAAEKLKALAAVEKDLRLQLAGLPRKDPETGLTIPAEL